MNTPAETAIDEIIECAVKWISDDADHPDTPPENWQAAFALMRSAVDLVDALKDVTRICESVRYTVGLGKNQLERIAKANALIAKAGSEP